MSKDDKKITGLIKVILSSFLVIWFLLVLVEWVVLYYQKGEYVYWRGWEKTANYQGKEAGMYPFKPYREYIGKFEGDLLNVAFLNPSPDELRIGRMQIDEFGHRNEPGFLNQSIDAVVMGSSFVSGAAFDQSELVSTILTDQYQLRTYNYSGSLQTFWENQLFWDHSPDYVILVGAEGEIISAPAWTTLNSEVTTRMNPRKWDSFKTWQTTNDSWKRWNFARLESTLKNYSWWRYWVIKSYRFWVNTGRSRELILAASSATTVDFHKPSGSLLYQPIYDDPRLGSPGKTPEDIERAIESLNQAQAALADRGITLVVVGVPSKTHLTFDEYKELPQSAAALAVFNNQAKQKATFINVDLYTPLIEEAKKSGHLYYYKDDSHWSPEVNEIIGREMSKQLNF